jgi:DNA polymerase-3 subunit gamma/tau
MSYQVLARKWRPQTFDEVVGQEHVTRTLKNALEMGRVAHAFLFSGPRGVGKTSVARILAKSLNCAQGPTTTPCNQCQACQEITQGHSLDVLEIDGASNRGIDEVRELRENIKYLPAHGGYKVFIIDEVHMLTKEAFNALLKTLEEPPPHAIFILATTEAHKVPVTILSRCQRYDFRRLTTAAIQAHLGRMAAQEGWSLAPEGLQLIAQEAEGGMRDAQGLLDQVITFGGPAVTPAEIARILGVTERRLLLETLTALVQRQGPRMLEIVAQCHEQGHDLRRFYQDLLWASRNLLLAKLGATARGLADLADQEWEQLQALAQPVSLAHLANLLTTLLKGEEELRRSPHPRLSLEVLLLRLVSLEPVLDLPEWLARLESLELRLAQSPAAAGAEAPVSEPPRPAAPAPAAEVPALQVPAAPAPAVAVAPTPAIAAAPAPEPLEPPDTPVAPAAAPVAEGDRWQAFLAFVDRQDGGPLAGRLAGSRLVGQEDEILRVAPTEAWRTALPQHQEQLQDLVRQFFGPHYVLKFETATGAAEAGREPHSGGQLTLAELKPLAGEIFGGQWLRPQKTAAGAQEEK